MSATKEKQIDTKSRHIVRVTDYMRAAANCLRRGGSRGRNLPQAFARTTLQPAAEAVFRLKSARCGRKRPRNTASTQFTLHSTLPDSKEAIMTTRKPKPKPTPSPLIELIELSTEQLQLVTVTVEPKSSPRAGRGTEVPVLRTLPARGKNTLH
jgi:hypothetical protein